jgi:hypothetical protein
MKRLPPELLKSTRIIGDIKDGERTWALLDAVMVDQEGKCWLSRYYTIHSKDWVSEMVEIFNSGGELHITIPRKQYRASDAPTTGSESWLPVNTVQFRRRSWIHKLLRG